MHGPGAATGSEAPTATPTDSTADLCDREVAKTGLAKVRIYADFRDAARLVGVLHRYWTDFNNF